MRWKKTVTMVEAHAEGEVGRVVTSPTFEIPGANILEKMNYLNETDDSLRRFCVFEPRGCAQMSTNLLFPPSSCNADAAFIILQGDKAHAMSGSNAICVTTVLLETGILEMKEPETIVRLETPAGIITARATCKNGKCERVTLDMIPGFVEELDMKIAVPGLGEIIIDIAFGGIYYALIDPRQLDLKIAPDQARTLVDAGTRIHRALNKTLKIQHPEIPSINKLSYTMFVDEAGDGQLIGATILPPGRVDRSPCGTGSTARFAARYARGLTKIGDKTTIGSIIGSTFDIELNGETKVGDKTATLTNISGRGWIHGIHQIGIDPTDPFQEGYYLSDTWGDAFDLLN
jgi:proline racemase